MRTPFGTMHKLCLSRLIVVTPHSRFSHDWEHVELSLQTTAPFLAPSDVTSTIASFMDIGFISDQKRK